MKPKTKDDPGMSQKSACLQLEWVTMGMPRKQGQWKIVTGNKKGFKNWCFSFRSHNLRQIMGSQQIPSAVQFGSQVIWKMENTSLASVSPGTATKKQASMEGKHRTRERINQTSSKGGQHYTRHNGEPGSAASATGVNREQTSDFGCSSLWKSPFFFKTEVRDSEVWMTSTISYNAPSWARSRTMLGGGKWER